MKPTGSQDQTVDIPFAGGMDEGTAPFIFNGPAVTLAEDCVVTKTGAYKRSPGGTEVPFVGYPSMGLATFDGTLVQHSVIAPMQLNETQGAWRTTNLRGFVPTQERSDLIYQPSFVSVYNVCSAVSSGGYELFIWDEQRADRLEQLGRSWLQKRAAIRDPAGGWSMPVSVVGGPSCAGHAIIAIGATFLFGYSTGGGFQVFKLPEAAPTLTSSRTFIVTNAAGASGSAGFIYSSVRDVCLSTDGTKAYFLVNTSSTTTYYVYTVDLTGQVGTASTGTVVGSTGTGFSICVDNAKVYVAFTGASASYPPADCTIANRTESTISTGGTFTIRDTFLLASGKLGFRVRIGGAQNTGIYVAVESTTADVATPLTINAAVFPSIHQTAVATYVEVGFYPTADAASSYTAVEDRAYAHGYCLGSSMAPQSTTRGAQILVCWVGVVQQMSMQKKDIIHAGPPTLDTEPIGNWEGASPNGYLGGIWLEIISQATPNPPGQQGGGPSGTTAQRLRLRSLARVGWDSAAATLNLLPTVAGSAVAEAFRICSNAVLSGVSSNYIFGFTTQGILDSRQTTMRAVGRCKVDLAPPPPSNVTAHNDLYMDGGCQAVWDGLDSYESTPHFPPAVVWVPTNLASEIGDPTGYPSLGISSAPRDAYGRDFHSLPWPTYPPGVFDTWSFYWEYVDARAMLHRSAVSTITITSRDTYTTAEEWYPPGYFGVLPPLSSNGAAFGDLRLCVAYKATVHPEKQTSSKVIAKYGVNWEFTHGKFYALYRSDLDRASTGVRLTPGYSYQTEHSRLPLYTDGGVLQADAPPSPASLTATRDRLWAISSDDRRKLFFTKPIESGIAPEFSSALTVLLPAEGGEGIAITTVDDKPIVLCERGIYVLVGDGPNALGTGGDFQAQVVQTDTGCTNKNSLGKCDYGVLFQGDRGIYLLDRGLNTQLISAGVQDRASLPISATVSVPNEQQIRFGLEGGGVLVYHYALKAWTVLNKTAYDHVVWDGEYTRVYNPATASMWRSDGASNQDGEGPIEMRVITGWIKPNAIMNFARFKRLQILMSQGAVATDDGYGPLSVTAYFNYEYGGEGTYTEGVTWNSAGRHPATLRAQNEMRIGKQKAESIKFKFVGTNFLASLEPETVPDTYFDPVALEGLSLTVGTITSTQFRQLRKGVKG